VLAAKIVPSDERRFVVDQIEKIWNTPGRQVSTKCIYTDNARVDTNLILESFGRTFPNRNNPPAILQVFLLL
jgi:hypothetical protein